MKPGSSSRARVAGGLAVSIVLLAGLLYTLDAGKLLASLAGIDLACLAIALLLMPVFVLSKVYKWHFLVGTKVRVPFGDSLVSFLAGASIGLLTPARTGELTRAVYLPVPNRSAFAGLAALDKVLDLLGILLLSCLGSAIILGLWATLAFLTAFVVILIGLFSLPRLYRFIAGHRTLSGRAFIVALSETVAVSPRAIMYGFILTISGFMVVLVQCYCLVRAFVPVDPVAILFSFPLAILTSIVPITVSGLGLREGTAVLLLGHFGVPGPDAFNAAFLLFFINTFLPAMGGVPAIFLRHGTAPGNNPAEDRQGE